MLQGICTTEVTPIARVPWNDPALIMKMLDAGAYGIICPMINTRAEAERFVGACRYAPVGYRSSGPIRAALWAGDDYHAKANDTVLTFAMIETAEAVRNLDEILTTPGLDAVYIGPVGSVAHPRRQAGPGPYRRQGGRRHRHDPGRVQAPRRARGAAHRQPRLRQADDRQGLRLRHPAQRQPHSHRGGRKIVEETKSIAAQAKAGGVKHDRRGGPSVVRSHHSVRSASACRQRSGQSQRRTTVGAR